MELQQAKQGSQIHPRSNPKNLAMLLGAKRAFSDMTFFKQEDFTDCEGGSKCDHRRPGESEAQEDLTVEGKAVWSLNQSLVM